MRHDLWLARHGRTEWTESRRHTGATDIALTADGERDARTFATVLGDRAFALVLTSPLRRAADTARLAGFADAEALDDLREWDYGDYEGLTTAQIRESDPGWTVWQDRVPSGESVADVTARVRRVLARADQVDGDVLVFAHGHLLRVLAAVALGFGAAAGARFALDPGAYGIIGWEHEHRTLRAWNARP